MNKNKLLTYYTSTNKYHKRVFVLIQNKDLLLSNMSTLLTSNPDVLQ